MNSPEDMSRCNTVRLLISELRFDSKYRQSRNTWQYNTASIEHNENSNMFIKAIVVSHVDPSIHMINVYSSLLYSSNFAFFMELILFFMDLVLDLTFTDNVNKSMLSGINLLTVSQVFELSRNRSSQLTRLNMCWIRWSTLSRGIRSPATFRRFFISSKCLWWCSLYTKGLATSIYKHTKKHSHIHFVISVNESNWSNKVNILKSLLHVIALFFLSLCL